MKKTLLFWLVMFSVSTAFSQSIGIGTDTPHASAKLEINATDKGLLIPRLSSAQRNAIKLPAPGLLVFDVDAKDFWFFSGTEWKNLSAPLGAYGERIADSAWLLTGNSGTDSSLNFIGTTDDKHLLFRTNNQQIGLMKPGGSVIFYHTNAEYPDFDDPFHSQGQKMFWHAPKGAFRAGYVDASNWDEDSIGMQSFAGGWNTKALGDYSNAFGFNSFARGDFSTAIGAGAIANAFGSMALGYNANASNDFALAMGISTNASGSVSAALNAHTTASGANSLATGFMSVASGATSTAMGVQSTASGAYSTAVGYQGIASGYISTSIGYQSVASVDFAIATGHQTTASGRYSFTGGSQTFAKAQGAVSLGMYNDNSDNPNPFSSAATDRIFQLGNGDAATRKNAITVLRSGNMGLGSINPRFPLSFSGAMGGKISLWDDGNAGGLNYGIGIQSGLMQLYTYTINDDIAFGFGSSSSFTERMRIKGNGNVGIGTNAPGFPLNFANTLGDKIALWGNSGAHYGFGIQGYLLQIHTDGAASDVAFGHGTSASFTETMRIKGNGNVGIGTSAPSQKLHVAGNICATGTIGSCSDIRYKTNFQPVQNALASVRSLNGFYYHWRDDEFPAMQFNNERQIGFSAQEIEKLFPELVMTDANGYKSVDYGRLTPVLVEAVKEQQQQIDEMKKELRAVKELLERLTKQ